MVGMMSGKEAVTKAQREGPEKTKNQCDGSCRCFYVCGGLLLRLPMRMKGGEEACGGHTSVYQADPTCMHNEEKRQQYIQDDLERYMLVLLVPRKVVFGHLGSLNRQSFQ